MVKNEDWGILVHAKTPGKARSRFIRCEPSMDIDRSFWNNIRLTRVPALDNKPFTYKNVLDAGYMYIDPDIWDEWDNHPPIPETQYSIDCNCEICRQSQRGAQ